MTVTQELKWIKTNLSITIKRALIDSDTILYTEPWLAGMVEQETGWLIGRYGNSIADLQTVSSLMKGDFTQRPGEAEKQYHGFGFIQVDIASYPDFVKSGDWKDPYKNIMKAISILEEKRKYLLGIFPELSGDSLNHYITAAFNCGQGNEAKVIHPHLDPDAYTAHHSYAKNVFDYANQYFTL